MALGPRSVGRFEVASAAVAGLLQGALSIEPPLPGSVVTIGTFDGVHRGHQALLERAVHRARRVRLPVVAYTFDPHPAALFSPRPPRMLQPLDRRVHHLTEHGADRVVVERFDRAFSEVEADDWVVRYLVERLRPDHVVVGFNFSFGRGRAGDPDRLRRLGTRHGFSVEVVEPVAVGGRIGSSTEVRRLVAAGAVEEASELLGRAPAVVGPVVPGDQRGRELGFPTANVAPEHDALPGPGVYAGWLVALDGPPGPRLKSVINVGHRPTFGGETMTVEAHVLDARLDLYGVRVELAVERRLRDERRFDDPAALQAQIAADVAEARASLEDA